MKRDREAIDTLQAELRWDLDQIPDLIRGNLKAHERIRAGATDQLDYAALGYTLHNLYGVMENACYRIAKFFENGLSASSWHRDLLERMRLEIPDLRPAFLSKEEFLLLDELRAFRHVFRNLYNRPLDPQRLELVQAKVGTTHTTFIAAVDRYLDFLEALKGSLP